MGRKDNRLKIRFTTTGWSVSMGPNVAGVITTAIISGIYVGLLR